MSVAEAALRAGVAKLCPATTELAVRRWDGLQRLTARLARAWASYRRVADADRLRTAADPK